MPTLSKKFAQTQVSLLQCELHRFNPYNEVLSLMNQQKHILLVDDDIQLHELVEDALLSLNVRLTAVIHTKEGLEIAEKEQPDLIFMDLLMPAPNLKGWDAIAALKSNPHTSHIPTFALTAANNESILKALQAGADDYVTKPFTISRFQAFIMRHVGAVGS
jgi:two-component system, cell cycle response regulator